MIKVILSIAFGLMVSTSFTQEIRTLFSNDSRNVKTYGSYGGPFVQATQLNNDWGVIVGGKGGMIVNRKFAFGGIGMGLASKNNFLGDDLIGDEAVPLTLNYGGGGLFFEYIFNVENPIHFSIPVNVMAGQVSIDKVNTGEDVESTGIYIVEPGFNLEFNVSETFIPAINVSYRQVFGSSLTNLRNQDISGINFGVVFKFGSF